MNARRGPYGAGHTRADHCPVCVSPRVTLDVVDTLVWKEGKGSQVPVPSAMMDQMIHLCVSSRLKHPLIVACMSTTGYCFIPYNVIFRTLSTLSQDEPTWRNAPDRVPSFLLWMRMGIVSLVGTEKGEMWMIRLAMTRSMINVSDEICAPIYP
jgi:hypothetical protein